MVAGRGGGEGTGSEALREIRRARRQRYVEELDVMELLYRAYVVGLIGIFALGLIAGIIDEVPATPSAVDWTREQGPAVIGIPIAIAVFAGLRTGARGGPLAIEPAEVQYVLLAPVDRGLALRQPALRQIRIAALVGGVLGAIVGNFVFHRLPGSPVEWIGCVALYGALLPVCALGAALFASGRRLTSRAASGAGLLFLAWSGVDVALESTTSPSTMLGELATLPLQHGVTIALAAAGAVLSLALVVIALQGVGGIRLEAARLRAALTAELRFSASVQDLRTVVLLRRQLASERPRRRPWLRPARSGKGRRPIWRRGWQSFLRWPAARFARAAVIGIAAGALSVGAWSASLPALFLPGVLLFVVALDFIEPLAQESDHPTRRRLLPTRSASLMRLQLGVPTLAIAIVLLIATGTAVLVGGGTTALTVGLISFLPAALVLACCAALSATNDPYEFMYTPEIAYGFTTAPIAASSMLIALPLLSARLAEEVEGGSAAAAAVSSAVVMTLIAAAGVALLGLRFRRRDQVSA
jgi:hypothetical protein